MKPFPFSNAMQFGLGVLRLAPTDFWAMTPRELSAAYQAFQPLTPIPIDQNEMHDLMQRFPDEGGYE